jgi:hypothetical protein
MSNFEEARRKLPLGIGGFDFTLVRTPDDAQSVIWTLPNKDRGAAARALFDVREKIGREVRGDNQDERAASIRMRMRRGRTDGGRA